MIDSVPPQPPSSLPPSPPPLPPKAKLTWYQYLWIGWPIALVALGGALGGLFGGGACALNKSVFEKTANPVLRYVYTGLISFAAVLCYLVAAVFFLSLIHKNG